MTTRKGHLVRQELSRSVTWIASPWDVSEQCCWNSTDLGLMPLGHVDVQGSAMTCNSGGSAPRWTSERGKDTNDLECNQTWFIHVIYLSSTPYPTSLSSQYGHLFTVLKSPQQWLLSVLLIDNLIVHYTYFCVTVIQFLCNRQESFFCFNYVSKNHTPNDSGILN